MFKNVFDKYRQVEQSLFVNHLKEGAVPSSFYNIQAGVRQSISSLGLLASSFLALGSVESTNASFNPVLNDLNQTKPSHKLSLKSEIRPWESLIRTGVRDSISKNIPDGIETISNQKTFRVVGSEYKGKGPIEWLMQEYGLSLLDASKAWPKLVSSRGELIKNPMRDFALGKSYFLAPTIEDAERYALNLRDMMTKGKFQLEEPKLVTTEKKEINNSLVSSFKNETPQVSVSLSQLKEKISEVPNLKKAVLDYGKATGRGLSLAQTIEEYAAFRKNFSVIDRSVHNIPFANQVETKLNGILGENMTAQDYAFTIASLETSGRRILDGLYTGQGDINGARQAWGNYQKGKETLTLTRDQSKIEKFKKQETDFLKTYQLNLDSIVKQAVGPDGDSGNYRFMYLTALGTAKSLGLTVRQTSFGCEINDGNKTYSLVKDRNRLRMAVRNIIEEGVQKGFSDSQIEASLASIDMRFDNAMMKVFTQANLLQTHEILKSKFGHRLNAENRVKLAMMAHNTGLGGAIKIASNGSIQNSYLNKAFGLIALAGYETSLSKNASKILQPSTTLIPSAVMPQKNTIKNEANLKAFVQQEYFIDSDLVKQPNNMLQSTGLLIPEDYYQALTLAA